MNELDTYLNLIGKPRNVYENAELYPQRRLSIAEMQPFLQLSEAESADFPTADGVLDCRAAEFRQGKWAQQNTKFLNYHKSLTPYTLLNGLPFNHYLGIKTGIAFAENKVVVDVGGGTGQTLVNFFRRPETLTYFLVDPNVRLLHDQFIRVYPSLLTLKMGHILAMGEALPFKDEAADIVLCFAAIDHMADYRQFLKEAHRILRGGGTLLVTGHIEVSVGSKTRKIWRQFNVFSPSFLEFIARRWHQFRNRVALDDHTVHFDSTAQLEKDLRDISFHVEQAEVVAGSTTFFISATK